MPFILICKKNFFFCSHNLNWSESTVNEYVGVSYEAMRFVYNYAWLLMIYLLSWRSQFIIMEYAVQKGWRAMNWHLKVSHILTECALQFWWYYSHLAKLLREKTVRISVINETHVKQMANFWKSSRESSRISVNKRSQNSTKLKLKRKVEE